jgi:hypothetical protein
MVLRIPRPIGLTALVYALFSAAIGIDASAGVARADDCLTAPNSATPQGSHWYYRMDWANQRKCWYLRAAGQPPQQAAPQAAAMTGATADSPGPQRSPEGSGAAAISQAVAPPARVAGTGATWPDPPPTIAAPAAANAVAVSNDGGAGSAGRNADLWTFEDSESVVGRAALTATAAMPQSVTATPIEMPLALAFGLAGAGILSRIVMKFAARRRDPAITKYVEPNWIDDTRLQLASPDDWSEVDRSEWEFIDQRQADQSADLQTERGRPAAASSPRQNLASAPPLRPSIEDLETTERVIMRVLEHTRA